MPRGYSRDLRERLLQAVTSGLSLSEVAARTGVSARTLSRWCQKQAHGESLEIGVRPGAPRKIPADQEDVLRRQVAAIPDATLAEHCAAWARAGYAPVSTATMSRTLQRLNLPLKKRR
jgi:transposase